MRKLIVVAVLLVAGVAWGKGEVPQIPINEDGEGEYSGTVEVDGVFAGELYSRAKAWVATAYNSAQDVVQLNDRDAHRLIVKGQTSSFSWLTDMTYVPHTLTIETKDGRYRYTMTVFQLQLGRKYPGKKRLLKDTHAEVSAILADLWLAMESETDDDW